METHQTQPGSAPTSLHQGINSQCKPSQQPAQTRITTAWLKKQQLANTTIVYQRLIHVDVPTDLSQNYPKRDLAKHPQSHPHIRLRHMC